MSTTELTTLRDAAMTLPDQERAKLASDLIASLDGSMDSDAAQA